MTRDGGLGHCTTGYKAQPQITKHKAQITDQIWEIGDTYDRIDVRIRRGSIAEILQIPSEAEPIIHLCLLCLTEVHARDVIHIIDTMSTSTSTNSSELYAVADCKLFIRS